MNKPLGVVLAGGLSRRMGGGDKSLLKLGDRTLLSRVIERLEPQVSTLALNANGDADRFAEFSVPVISDSIEGFVGPLAGVLAGLDWAASLGADAIVTAAADTPFFPEDMVARFVAAEEETEKPIILAATMDPERGLSRHPTFGLWSVALRDDLRQALNDGVRRVMEWSEKQGCGIVEFPTEPIDPFFNVNTPEDMARAEVISKENAA